MIKQRNEAAENESVALTALAEDAEVGRHPVDRGEASRSPPGRETRTTSRRGYGRLAETLDALGRIVPNLNAAAC